MGFLKNTQESQLADGGADLEDMVRRAIGEYMRQSSERQEPALKNKLGEERRRREGLERKLSEAQEENARARRRSDQVDKSAQIRSVLQELGVRRVDLAFKLVKDDMFRGEDGELYANELYANVDGTQVPCDDYLAGFVSENPEFLPPRIAGGAGAAAGSEDQMGPGFDLNRIRPGMSREDTAQAWREVARLTGQQ